MPNSYFRNINIGKPFYAIFYNTPYTKVSQNYSKKKKSETDVHSFKSIDFIWPLDKIFANIIQEIV